MDEQQQSCNKYNNSLNEDNMNILMIVTTTI